MKGNLFVLKNSMFLLKGDTKGDAENMSILGIAVKGDCLILIDDSFVASSTIEVFHPRFGTCSVLSSSIHKFIL
jgi:hypothetical protein